MVKAASVSNKTYIDQGRVNFIHAGAADLPFDDYSFDKIFTINTFYFWDDHDKVLRELKRVLKKDGTLILSLRPKNNLEQIPVTKYNFALIPDQDIIELLHSNGFTEIEITKIEEPDRESWGQLITRETLILQCKLSDIKS